MQTHYGYPSMVGYAIRDAYAITLLDADLPRDVAALYVGVAGDIAVTTIQGVTLTFKNVPVGMFHVAVKRVWLTGTTASQIIGIVE